MSTITSPQRTLGRPRGGGLAGAVASEWTKLWSVRNPWGCVVAGLGLMSVFTYYYAAIARINHKPIQPVANAPVTAVILVQFVVVALAMTMVTNEYANGSVRATLLWVPVRARMLLAKTLVAGGVSFVLGLVLGVLGVAIAWPAFGGHATFGLGEVASQLLKMSAYLALVAVLTVGTAVALRSEASTFAAVFFLLAALPTVLVGIGGEFLTTVNDALPQSAGNHFALGHTDPYPPEVGFCVVLGWAVLAHVVGLTVLRRRDA
ncbi:ABC transporter permease [Streptoalloteichus hindustanus]|uniref:ABC-2 type transport system permease protein n=1 Tax=Streptoalloteichus hindustanus TaxID=2017 RepID=A0A1M5DQY9_STRHI|nr:ABC transporter permease [Streptoalloteichus hindustanus]SHF69393.1 hypothetical protein SAMN05444320_104567 [Streptoalloteichus hindustanus]